jgi:putative PIN family toxin of toxin-antitoxin system
VSPPRVAIDTNVLVSALIADGPASQIVKRALDDQLVLIIPDAVLSELERVLVVKLELAVARAGDLMAVVAAIAAERAPRPELVPVVTGHRPDDEILAAARDAGPEILVTYDRRHLLPLGVHRGVRILTPQALLAALARRADRGQA